MHYLMKQNTTLEDGLIPKNGEFQFNYLCLNLSDFDSQDIIERIEGLTFINGIAYKVIERNEQPNQ